MSRYDRQEKFAPLGLDGQRRLRDASVLIVGVGGLGSALAEMLCRAGVGRLRLLDADIVEQVNLHRQHLYTEADARLTLPKVQAAKAHLAEINAEVATEALVGRLCPDNALAMLDGIDLALDGVDNWPGRFLLNDACVEANVPWVLAGVVKAEAVTMTIIPGQTACLQCVYDQPPPAELHETCAQVGVLGPAVGAIANIQAIEAIKILAGAADAARPNLLRMDFWTNRIQQLDLSDLPREDCPCCRLGRGEFLRPGQSG